MNKEKQKRLVNLDDLLLSINAAFDSNTAKLVTEYIKDYPIAEPDKQVIEMEDHKREMHLDVLNSIKAGNENIIAGAEEKQLFREAITKAIEAYEIVNGNKPTREMKEVNINKVVKVKLTEFGRNIYFHQHDQLNEQYGRLVIEPEYPKTDPRGYTEFQLWILMNLYGSHLSSTGTVENNTLPFETTLLI